MYTKRILNLCFLALIISIIFSSCATILSGTKDRIVVNTNPTNVDVYIDGKLMGKSSQDILLHRKYVTTNGNVGTRNVLLKKEGYEDLSFEIELKIEPTYWLGIFTGGFAMFVDIVTGAVYKPKQVEFNRNLTPIKK